MFTVHVCMNGSKTNICSEAISTVVGYTAEKKRATGNETGKLIKWSREVLCRFTSSVHKAFSFFTEEKSDRQDGAHKDAHGCSLDKRKNRWECETHSDSPPHWFHLFLICVSRPAASLLYSHHSPISSISCSGHPIWLTLMLQLNSMLTVFN